MRRLGMPVSDTTILRSLKEHARVRSDNGAVKWLALMTGRGGRGANYGTIMVFQEHETSWVVDLLADRSAATTASWFKDHAEVEVVGSDRAGLYAEAARQGAPQARQVRAGVQAWGCCRTSARAFSDSSVALRRRSRILGSIPEMMRRRPPLPARSDCASEAETQKRLMCRGRPGCSWARAIRRDQGTF